MLNVGPPRDKLLCSLCEFALMNPTEEVQAAGTTQDGLLVPRWGECIHLYRRTRHN
jgi:hypothetical protein